MNSQARRNIDLKKKTPLGRKVFSKNESKENLKRKKINGSSSKGLEIKVLHQNWVSCVGLRP